MAAVLACGRGAALSHRSAGALWGICGDRVDGVEVTIPRPAEVRRSGLHVRARPSLAAEDVVIEDWIPVTNPAQTLLDLATVLGSIALERAINEADKLDLIDPDELRLGLERFAGQPGVRGLRRVLDRHSFRLSDSVLEILFRRIAANVGLPSPVTKAMVNGFAVDFYWPDLNLVVETDGLRYHRTPSQQAKDRLRDQAHTAAGTAHLRFTHSQVKHERRYVEAILNGTAARLRASIS